MGVMLPSNNDGRNLIAERFCCVESGAGDVGGAGGGGGGGGDGARGGAGGGGSSLKDRGTLCVSRSFL